MSLDDLYRSVADQDLLPQKFVSYMQGLGIQPRVIYDIGSSTLHWHRHASVIWPDSDIYLFEANPHVQTLYTERGIDNHHIGVLCDQDEKMVDFWLEPENTAGNSYYRERTAAYQNTRPWTRVGMRLDSVVINQGWPLPDLVKVDVQGAELDVARGARMCLEQAQDVFVECQLHEYNEGAPNVEQTLSFFERIGFEVVAQIDRTNVDADYHLRKVDK